MASTKTRRVNGVALKIVGSIKPCDQDELNVRRFSRLAGMLGDEQLAWQVLDKHNKAKLVSDARERIAEGARKRRLA